MDEIGLYLQSFRQGNIINQRSMKYMVHRGHKKLWHCCSTISMLDILSEQWWFNYSGSAEHWNRSQSFAQVADWNITLHQPLLSYRGIIKKLTSFTMLSVDNQLLEASLSASMKKMSLPDIKTISYEWLALTGVPPGRLLILSRNVIALSKSSVLMKVIRQFMDASWRASSSSFQVSYSKSKLVK